jgi:hypothetical protein
MMKSEPRPFASLSSGLLARKGAARPAMRPQGFGQGGNGLEDLGWNDMGFEPPKPVLLPVGADDEPVVLRPNPVTGLTPASPVHAVHEELAHRFSPEAEEQADEVVEEIAEPVAVEAPRVSEVVELPVRAEAPVAAAPVKVAVEPRNAAPRTRRAASAKGKAAFTLRLDVERHLKLRLACAVTGTSAQLLVTRALDELLGSMPELDAMAERAPERAQQKR